MSETALSKAEVEALFNERENIRNWLNPQIDPAVWPPVGYQEYPGKPGFYYRIVSEATLREELFGSPQKEQWTKAANDRLAQIDAVLLPYFFPDPDDEGIQRDTKDGFLVAITPGLNRVLDEEAVPLILKECPSLKSVLKETHTLDVKKYRKLPAEKMELLQGALTITRKPTKFQIFRKGETGKLDLTDSAE